MCCHIFWSRLHIFSHCSLHIYIKKRTTLQQASIVKWTCTLKIFKSDFCVFVFSPPSPFLRIYTVSDCPYGMVSMETELVGEKKVYRDWVSYFFPPNFSLSLSSALTFCLLLPLSFTVSQAVCGAINIINQHNSTALSSAGRDEEARGNVNMPAWSSLNQWYISHIIWMRAGARRERQRGTGEADRERQITQKWKYAF